MIGAVDPGPGRPLLSVITPVLNEAAGLDRYMERVGETLLSRTDIDVEILFVDDGSSDESWPVIRRLAERDSRVRGLRLSRNFGSHAALAAGFREARGQAVATLPADLQDPPETVLEMMERWRAGAEVVWGCRRSRQDARWRIVASATFLAALRRFAMPRGSRFCTGSFLLIDRKVVDCLNEMGEHHRITFALVAWTGFDQDVVLYDRQARTQGRSGWSFGRSMKAMLDAFIGFSDLPARLITWMGLGAFLFSLALAVYIVLAYVLTPDVQPGWTSLGLLVSGFFSMTFAALGVIAQYLHRVYVEVTRRPPYFISGTTDG